MTWIWRERYLLALYASFGVLLFSDAPNWVSAIGIIASSILYIEQRTRT